MQIFGFKDDSYNYEKMNKVLHVRHKNCIKTIMCKPESVTFDHYKELMQLTAEERTHICILVMESRKRIELLHLTRVVSMLL